MSEPSEWARGKAAQAWCEPSTETLTMIPELCDAFARILDSCVAEANGDVEQLRVQLAGVLTAADGHRPDPPVTRGMYGWSPAYDAVFNLRRRLDEELAKNEQT